VKLPHILCSRRSPAKLAQNAGRVRGRVQTRSAGADRPHRISVEAREMRRDCRTTGRELPFSVMESMAETASDRGALEGVIPDS